MEATLKIGQREYTITGTEEKVNNFGQRQIWTGLRGKRGAEVALVETFSKYGSVLNLIHFGRQTPGETVYPYMIKR
jgi:hypothetical protein